MNFDLRNPYTRRRVRRFFRRLVGLPVPSQKTGQWDDRP